SSDLRLMQHLRRRVKAELGLPALSRLHGGVLTVAQRFRADLGLYVHLHCLALDGVYEQLEDGSVRFHPLADLHEEELLDILRRVHSDLHRQGHLDDDLDLAAGIQACVRLGLSVAARPLQAVASSRSLEVTALDMNLHAATTVDGRDRKRLEKLARYLLRP